jgi:hypothetical protein
VSALPESIGPPEDASAEGTLTLEERNLSNFGLTDDTSQGFALHLTDDVPFGTETVSPGISLGDVDGAGDQEQELADVPPFLYGQNQVSTLQNIHPPCLGTVSGAYAQ